VKRGGHIKSNNSGTAKVKIVKNERDPPLFTVKLLLKISKHSEKHYSLPFQSYWT
jgi:hypothetical protein